MKGRLLVIEGLDGSGKATQTEQLYKRLREYNLKLRRVSFPDYDSPAAGGLKLYLDGAFGGKPGDVNAYAASTMFAVDRYASYRQHWREDYLDGGIILCDRYTTSNAIHQTSKLPREQWDEFLDWLYDFEFNKLHIPPPGLVLFLDVEPEVSQNLMDKRYAASGGHKDIHEQDLAYLQRCREAALYCAEKLGWVKIPCTENGELLSIEHIHERVFDIVSKELTIL